MEREINNSMEKRSFEEIFLDVINDRYWCESHGIDYVSPDYRKVRAELTQELCRNEKRDYEIEA